ncbi:MAG TPA: XRE family transcriptional regulator [Clostridiales bacterium]|nr:XRE family transcriptional regulator [Clostridiales bacterium]
MLNYIELGKNIQKYRLEKKVTQAQLAEAINVSTVFISHIETSSTKPSLETIVNIANELNVTVDELLKDSLLQSSKIKITNINNLLSSISDDKLELAEKIIKVISNH